MGDFGQAIAKMFTPSKSDNQSGAQYNAAYNAAQQASALPPAPSPDTALADANTQADQRRKTILATGGDTNKTSGGAILNPTAVATKSLLGS